MFSSRKIQQHVEQVRDRHQTTLRIQNSKNVFIATLEDNPLLRTDLNGFRRWVEMGLLHKPLNVIYNGVLLDKTEVQDLKNL